MDEVKKENIHVSDNEIVQDIINKVVNSPEYLSYMEFLSSYKDFLILEEVNGFARERDNNGYTINSIREGNIQSGQDKN